MPRRPQPEREPGLPPRSSTKKKSTEFHVDHPSIRGHLSALLSVSLRPRRRSRRYAVDCLARRELPEQLARRTLCETGSVMPCSVVRTDVLGYDLPLSGLLRGRWRRRGLLVDSTSASVRSGGRQVRDRGGWRLLPSSGFLREPSASLARMGKSRR